MKARLFRSALPLLLIFVLSFSACTAKTTPAGADPSSQASAPSSGAPSVPQASEAEKPAFPYTFTDSLGNTVTLQAAPQRVASLLGSYAETWLLAGGSLCGVTEDIISERGLAVDEGTEIIGTVKHPNAEALLALDPDFVMLSTDIESHGRIAQTLAKAGIAHAFFKVERFEDYLSMLRVCTDLTGRDDLYEQNGLAVREKIDGILAQARSAAAEKKPTVLFIRALSTAAKAKAEDNMTGYMLAQLGCDNIAARHASLLEDLSMEAVIEEDPDFIFVVAMGDGQKALDALQSGVQSSPAWNELSAVKNGRYHVLAKEHFHYKPNNRWGESYEILAKILYPDAIQ